MNTNLQTIFEHQEWEDQHMLRHHMETVLRQEYIGAERMIAKRRNGYCEPFPIPVPMRTARAFSVRKHTTVQRLYFHSHDFYEIIYVQNGNHTQYIANFNTPITLSSGEAILLLPGTVHALQSVTPGDMILKLVIPRNLLSDLTLRPPSCLQPSSQLDTQDFLLNDPLPDRSSVLRFHPSADCPSVENLIVHLAEEYYFGSDQKQARIQKYLRPLLAAFTGNQHPRNALPLTGRLISYIHGHLQTATLPAFAGYMGYSPRHIQRLLEEEGTSFSSLLRQLRLQKALKLLLTTAVPAEQIAQQTGFVTAAGFYKCFEAQFHITPGQYRKLHQMNS